MLKWDTMSASSETVRKGPRLVAMELEDEGYGFHMYTNKQLSGQYVKSISDTGAAKRAGLLIGDHVIEVDGINVEKESHAQVVARVREGQRTVLLVIDQETEAIFKRQGKKITEGSFVEVTHPSECMCVAVSTQLNYIYYCETACHFGKKETIFLLLVCAMK